MIYGKLNHIGRYRHLNGALDQAIDFLMTQDLGALPMGKTVVDGEKVYVNRFDYETGPRGITEAHFDYIDIHVVMEGEEKIGVADVSDLTENNRNEEEDFLGFEGPFRSICTMGPGDFLIVFPEDAHSPKLVSAAACKVKKVVMKVKDA